MGSSVAKRVGWVLRAAIVTAARLDSTSVDAQLLPRLAAVVVGLTAAAASAESLLGGTVLDATGAPVAGAMVSVSRGDPAHAVTVFSASDGAFAAPLPDDPGAIALRVRRIGYRDLRVEAPDAESVSALRLEPESDPAALAAQLPANHWYSLVLERVAESKFLFEGHRANGAANH